MTRFHYDLLLILFDKLATCTVADGLRDYLIYQHSTYFACTRQDYWSDFGGNYDTYGMPFTL